MFVILKDNSLELIVVRFLEYLRFFLVEWVIIKMCYFGVEVI